MIMEDDLIAAEKDMQKMVAPAVKELSLIHILTLPTNSRE